MNAMTPTTRQHELHVPALATAERLDALLARLLPQYSRSRIASWIRAGEVRLDGRAAKPSEKVFGGEGVSLQATLEPDTQVLAEALPIDVVHADEELVVVNKPAPTSTSSRSMACLRVATALHRSSLVKAPTAC